MSQKMVLYKVLNRNREAFHKDGLPFKWPAVRRWTKPVPNPRACASGYHLVTAGDLWRWLTDDAEIWLAEGAGEVDESESGEGKYCFERARLLERVGVLTPFVLRLWMAACAEKVAINTASDENPDGNPAVLAAIAAARAFAAGGISDDERSAAWSAARSAARSAAESAARSAARSAAESAAWSAARSAAESAARSAAESWQSERLLELLREQTISEAQKTHRSEACETMGDIPGGGL